MIVDLHALADEKDVKEIRDFLIDVVEYPFMDGDFWLVPALTSAEVGAPLKGGKNHHDLYLISDDLEATVKELGAKGVEFARPISETTLGYVTSIKAPGGKEIGMCQQKEQLVNK
ncbi:MAG: extradiol dioxygenase [Nitrososphaerales archaeon]